MTTDTAGIHRRIINALTNETPGNAADLAIDCLLILDGPEGVHVNLRWVSAIRQVEGMVDKIASIDTDRDPADVVADLRAIVATVDLDTLEVPSRKPLYI